MKANLNNTFDEFFDIIALGIVDFKDMLQFQKESIVLSIRNMCFQDFFFEKIFF